MKTLSLYQSILEYLCSEIDRNLQIVQIIQFKDKNRPKSSWEITVTSLNKLWQCVNRSSEVKDDDEWSTTTNDFVKSAFKDLSFIRDPKAMYLFDQLARTCLPTYANGEDMFAYARSIKERSDGSAVIILHVSDLKRFRGMMEHHDNIDSSTELHTLEEGLQFGS